MPTVLLGMLKTNYPAGCVVARHGETRTAHGIRSRMLQQKRRSSMTDWLCMAYFLGELGARLRVGFRMYSFVINRCQSGKERAVTDQQCPCDAARVLLHLPIVNPEDR
jgi:hypothetical protein